MPKFRVFDEDKKDCCSCCGDRVHVLYESRLGKDGNLELFEAGKQDIREFIQASADSCDIHKIIARYKAGDTTALNRRQNPIFGDFTGLGTDIISTLNNIDLSKRQFESLPLSEREKFGNNHAVWLQAMVTGGASSVAVDNSTVNGSAGSVVSEVPVEPNIQNPSGTVQTSEKVGE